MQILATPPMTARAVSPVKTVTAHVTQNDAAFTEPAPSPPDFLAGVRSIPRPCTAAAPDGVARALALAAAAVDKVGPRLGGMMCEPQLVLVAAGLRGRAIVGVEARPGDQQALAELQRIVEPAGLRLEVDEDFERNGCVSLHSLEGYERCSKSSHLPGMVGFDAKSGWDGLQAWRERALEGLRTAQAEGRLPSYYGVAHLLYGVELGYPDIACHDFQAVHYWPDRPAGVCIRHIHCDGEDTSRDGGPQPTILAEHEHHPEVEATRAAWSRVLTAFERDPAQQARLQDGRFLMERRMVNDTVPASTDAFVRVASALARTRSLESYTSLGPLPDAMPALDGAAVARSLAEVMRRCGPRLTAALASPESVLALAGDRTYASLTLPAPTDDDLAAIDKANAWLAPRGARIGIGPTFLLDGALFVTSLQGSEVCSGSSGLPQYQARDGWSEAQVWSARTWEAANAEGLIGNRRLSFLTDGWPLPLAEAACRPQADVACWPRLPIRAGSEFGYAELSAPVPPLLQTDAAVGAWIGRAEKVLRDCYGDPAHQGLLADPAFKAARDSAPAHAG